MPFNGIVLNIDDFDSEWFDPFLANRDKIINIISK